MFKSFAYKADFTQLSSRRLRITYHPLTDWKVLTHFWFSSEICSHKIRRKKPYALMGFTFPPVGITKTNKKRMLYHETYFCKTLLLIVFNLHHHRTGIQFNHQSNKGDSSLYSQTGSKQIKWHHQLVWSSDTKRKWTPPTEVFEATVLSLRRSVNSLRS